MYCVGYLDVVRRRGRDRWHPLLAVGAYCHGTVVTLRLGYVHLSL